MNLKHGRRGNKWCDSAKQKKNEEWERGKEASEKNVTHTNSKNIKRKSTKL